MVRCSVCGRGRVFSYKHCDANSHGIMSICSLYNIDLPFDVMLHLMFRQSATLGVFLVHVKGCVLGEITSERLFPLHCDSLQNQIISNQSTYR